MGNLCIMMFTMYPIFACMVLGGMFFIGIPIFIYVFIHINILFKCIFSKQGKIFNNIAQLIFILCWLVIGYIGVSSVIYYFSGLDFCVVYCSTSYGLEAIWGYLLILIFLNILVPFIPCIIVYLCFYYSFSKKEIKNKVLVESEDSDNNDKPIVMGKITEEKDVNK